MGTEKTRKNWISAKEIADRTHVSYAAVNNYTDMGLLEVVAKEKRVRMYDREKTLERVARISRLLNEGYTLRVIVKLLRSFALVFFVSFIFSTGPGAAGADEDIVKMDEPEVAGEFFGQPVPMDNYRFVKAALLVFGSQWGAEPKTPQELEDQVWEQLLLSYEAFRRSIAVPQEKVDEEVDKLLKAEKVTFDRKADPPAYEKWVRDRTKEPHEAFENQLRHLIQLQMLRKQVMDSMDPPVSEEEAYQEYLDEYNTLSVELVQFDESAKAEAFFKKMKNPKLWESEAKKDPKFAVRPGFVSLECLMDLWKIPRPDAYAMLDLDVGSVYKPTPMYRGYGVFHTLQKRVAEKEKFSGVRASYFDQIKMKKRYEGYNEWLKQLKEDAHIKVLYRPEAPPQAPAGNASQGEAKPS